MITITVVAMMCHIVIALPLCHEVIVIRKEMSVQQCLISHSSIDEWKKRSVIYRNKEWKILEVMCQAGSYQLRDVI